ncbi:nicotinate-nucleotide--dimethylbenzimidazole phosphoribosyltransferase [Streptomyces sp. NPDC059909]|uniref:nicotinate-nucleotide--dimethylbenzimidazole phosphoribosyltransferase n=1 Tax=Streptomyces sp. NPDC059909 TaxID=3346998 RepID=UPI0036470B4D
MTDTGQIPGEGLPENAGMVEQPGIPAPGAYTFLDPSEHAAEPAGEDDDLLLMPGAQGAWSEPQPMAPQAASAPPVVPPVAPVAPQAPAPAPAPAVQFPMEGAAPGAAAAAVLAAVQQAAPQPMVQEPVMQEPVAPMVPAPAEQVMAEPVAPMAPEAASVPGPGAAVAPEPVVHEQVAAEQVMAERAVPVPHQVAPEPLVHEGAVHEGAVHEAGAHEAGGRDSGSLDLGGVRVPPPASAHTPPPTRRPLHMGPPVPDAGGGVVRSLSDRGPAGQPAGGGHTPPHPMHVRHAGPPTTGPEYLDVTREGAAVLAPPQPGEIPPQGAIPWIPMPAAPVAAAAETVVPEAVQVASDTALAAPAAAPAAAPGEVRAEAPVMASEPAPVGQFVPVEGSLPTTPHLAPSPVAVMDPVDEQPVVQEPVAVAPEPEAAEPVAEPVEAAVEPAAVAGEPVESPEPAAVANPVSDGPVSEAPASEGPVSEGLVSEEPGSEEPAPAPEPEPEAIAVVPAPRNGGAYDEPPAQPLEEPTGEPELLDEPAEPQAAAEAEPPSESVVPDDHAVTSTGSTPVPASAPAPGYDDAEREAVLRVMRERRDIRNGFRSDPIPHEVLLRVLEAAHTAPSVGHSQPWDFVVIRSAETRRTMHELAQRQREAYAKSLPKGRAKQFKELKIEAILDTPVNIVVTADPTRGGRHTLGRHTQPQMAPYSSALAVENLWLAARAEGLGVGWVSFFDEREMVRTLGLPEHLEVVAYLCVGYVDEFPEEPELMQAGWSKRRPLSWVVHEETYGRRALPGEEPHDLLQETVSNIRPLDAKALGEAWERQKRMTKPAGALGMLEIISAQLAGLSRMCPPPIPEPAAVAIFAGDHGVHAQGVTAWPQEVTGQMVANFLGGGAVCNAFANQVGAEVCVIDVGVASDLPATPGLLPRKVRPGTADFTTGPALTRDDVLAAIEVGIETARDLVAAGNKALLTGEMGIANTTASAALISVYTGVDAAEVTGRGTGINDEMHARKVDVVRRALDLHRPDPADPIGVLAAVGGLEHAALVGFILGGASLRTPVVLDGVSAGAAALVARAVAPEALAACIAGHRSAEPGHVAALNKLGLRPLVDLDLRLGEGTGALLALPLVQSAARAMHEVATFDSAGVTEK